MMKGALKKSAKSERLIFAGQMLFLILSFFLVLWGQKKLKDFSKKSASPAVEKTPERKARVLNPL